MTQASRGGVLVDLSAAQDNRPRRPASALHAEEVALALQAEPGLVRGLLLHPRLPLPGGLHPALLAHPCLCWSTATALRRLRGAGAVGVVVPTWDGVMPNMEAVPRDKGWPRLAVMTARDAVAAAADLVSSALGTTSAAAPVLVAVIESLDNPGVDTPWTFDAVVAPAAGRAAGSYPCILWLDGGVCDVSTVRGARAVIVPSEAAARRLRLALGAHGRIPAITIAGADGPEAAAIRAVGQLSST